MTALRRALLLLPIVLATAAAGCGSSTSSPTPTGPASGAASGGSGGSGGSGAVGSSGTGGSGAAGAGGSGPGALSADARSAATGDIPDNQVFLTFSARRTGFSIKYPEGWTQSGGSASTSFRDKNNIVRVLISRGPPPTASSVTAQLQRPSSAVRRLSVPRTVSLGAAGTAIKVVYETESAPNAVTGKRVRLMVDRYVLSRDGRVAVVDEGTPVGVDNVDAYRMMIESFRWR